MVKKEIPDSRSDKEHVKAEHHCLTNINHPFVVKLFCSFKTPSKLFYVMEFLQGGELYSWMERYKVFTKVKMDFLLKLAKFY